MDISVFLGTVSLARFVDEHLHRLPFALPGGAASIAHLASWELVEQITAANAVDMILVRDGETCPAPPGVDVASLQTFCLEGWTIRVRSVEQHSDAIRALATAFARAFRGQVDVHLYVTPPGRRGLAWHYDAEDVFILQTAGTKEYLLRKNTVHPWPLAETMPEDLRYERELMPLNRVVLDPGDLLYIPCGYWHRTESPSASSGAAISLAVGVMSPAAVDLLAPLRRRLADSLIWRQRLPVGAEANLDDRLQLLLSQLADEAARTLKSPEFFADVLALIGQQRRQNGYAGMMLDRKPKAAIGDAARRTAAATTLTDVAKH
jgi:50S ribosomal protein L16 3-hydroxylase